MANKRSFVGIAAAAAAVLQISGAAAEITRPNPTECEESVNFKEYAIAVFGDDVVCEAEECSYKVRRGSTFKLEYRDAYKVLSFIDSGEVEGPPGEEALATATYILYQCNQPKPDDAFIQSLNATEPHFVEIPVTAVATDDTSVGWLLEELEVQDRVKFASTYSTSPCMSKIAFQEVDGGCDRPFVSEWSASETQPATKPEDFDVEFGFAGNATKKQVYFQASTDPDPLGRAEKLMYLSAFFNKEQDAFKFYTEIYDTYTAATVTPSDSSPVVAWVSAANVTGYYYTNADGGSLSDNAVTVSFARYKTIFTGNAGARLPSQSETLAITGAAPQKDDIVFATSEFADEEAMLAAAGQALAGVDIIIDETYFFDPTTATLEGILAKMPSNLTAEVWRHDKDLARSYFGGYSDDWFGEGLARPDIVLQDLKGVVSGDPEFVGHFFRNMADSVNNTVHTLAECEAMTCDSFSNQAALSTEVTVAEAPEGSVPEGSEGSRSAVSSASSADAVVAWVVGAAGLVFAVLL